MFGLFGDKRSKLEKQLKRLLQESFEASTVDRKKSDLLAAEAEKVRIELEILEKQGESR